MKTILPCVSHIVFDVIDGILSPSLVGFVVKKFGI